ncbi:MAG: AsmA family protein, partial [Pseudomonadota bacterium]
MRWFAIIGGLLVLVLLAALAAPLFVNFDDYRARFEAEASRIFGQPVLVNGHISAQLVPFPSITLNDVQVGDSDNPLMEASSLALFAELAPFLSGQIRIFDAQLNDPVLQLEMAEGWSPQGALELPGLPSGVEVELENATISNGRILVRDAVNAQTWTVEVSQAEVSANSLAGPWRVDASTIVQARRVDAKFTIGQIAAGAEMVSLFGDLQFVDELTKLRIEGAVDLTQNGQFYDGTFTLSPVGELSTPYRIDGDFDVFADRVLIDTLTGNFGDLDNPYVVRGNAELIGGASPSYAIEVTGNQFGVAQAGNEQAADLGEARSSGRVARIVEAIRTLPIPAELPGTVKLDLPAVVLGGTIIRDLVLDARP